VPEVRHLRPGLPWEDVLRIVNSGLAREAQPWSLPRLIRVAKTIAHGGLLPGPLQSTPFESSALRGQTFASPLKLKTPYKMLMAHKLATSNFPVLLQ
jgi:hypothetical protein